MLRAIPDCTGVCHSPSSKHKPCYILFCFVWRPLFQLIILAVFLSVVPAVVNLMLQWGDHYSIFCTRQAFFLLRCWAGFCLFAVEPCHRMVPLVMSTSRKFLFLLVLMDLFFFTFLGVGVCLVLVCACVLFFLFFNRECSGVNYNSSKQYLLIYSLPFKMMCPYTTFTLEL